MTKKELVWNLTWLFKSDDDPAIEEDRKRIEKESYDFINKWEKRTDYLDDPKVMKEALDDYEKWSHFCGSDGNEGYYYWLKTSLDQNNPELKAKFNKIIEFSQKIENDIQFFTMRISKIDKTLQSKFLNAPELMEYSHFLSRLFDESKYLLTEPEEKIMNLKGKTSMYNWVKMTSGFLTREKREVWVKDGEPVISSSDVPSSSSELPTSSSSSGSEQEESKYRKEEKSFSEILSMIDDKDLKVRDEATKMFNEILEKWIDVAENEINSVLEDKKINDTLRNVQRPDELRHLADDIDSSIVDVLVDSVSQFYHISQKFYALKAKLLGLKKLKYNERNLEYGKIDAKYTFDEAVTLVHKVFSGLDPDFDKIFTSFLDEGRIDVYPREGKTSGAFLAHGLKSQPLYILLNFNEKLQDILTLSHEMGHGIHYQIAKVQNALNFGATLSTAEVASTFMEDFVLQEIMRNADEELKLALMVMKLNDEVSTIIRQIGIYKFELDLHKEFRIKGYLSKKDIGEIFSQNMAAYMGDAVEQSEGSQNWWIYISHIRSFFYVYSYASGLLISKSMQKSVKEDPQFINKVKEFFAAGESASPKDIFAKLGIDITNKDFWIKGLTEIEQLLKDTEALAVKLKKI